MIHLYLVATPKRAPNVLSLSSMMVVRYNTVMLYLDELFKAPQFLQCAMWMF